jgi:hypothetical protein
MESTQTQQVALFDDVAVGQLGSISIRVVVLPPKKRKGAEDAPEADIAPLDAEADELLPDAGATPLGSYLESSKGKRCCVFLVNGQRQDFLDNSFIMQELGFKYLRNRMMIVVDVDGLSTEAMGRLMQGSRQGFYKGDIWAAMMRRVVATLKNDPDLLRLEEEAEEQVSELKTGDENVKQTLDQLIQAHHEHGMHFSEGAVAAGESAAADQAGLKTEIKGGVVTLLPPDRGQAADYPVLFSQPASSTIRLRPDQDREISIKALPSNAWPALSALSVDPDPTVPELKVEVERQDDHAKVTFKFKQPAGFDTDQYPVRARVRVTAAFNGIEHRRQLELQIVIKPDREVEEPVLLDTPTKLTVSSREPVKITRGLDDRHVRLRWDGKDKLLLGASPAWRLSAQLLDAGRAQPVFNFSQPTLGRFSLLIGPRPEWNTGDRLNFEVTAVGPAGAVLRARFLAEVVDPPEKPEDDKPRLVDGEFKTGASRRPPYELKYITRDDYETIPCWGSTQWTDGDPGCFNEPTPRTPLMLIINEDMEALREYRRYLTQKYTETEVKRRTSRYTSHIAFHLYQMHQASTAHKEENPDEADMARREEIKRVSMTLIKLMEVAR